MNCKDCEHTYQTERKYGVTTHCKLLSGMDVSFYCRPRHIGTSIFCPLLKQKHIKDSTELSGGRLW